MNKTFIKIILLATFLIIVLTGCVSKVDTLVTLNDDFSGERVITCTVSRQKIRTEVNGGEAALDSLIRINCPTQMDYEKIGDQYNVVYNFIIRFNNREEYIDKIEKILGHKPLIVFDSPNSPFSKGFILQESFSSRDLLAWLEDIGKEKDILSSEGDFFTENSTVVNYNGNSIQTQQLVDIKNIEYLRIDKISVLTTMKSGGVFNRIVQFEVPNISLESNYQEIIDYMKQRTPDDGNFRIENVPDGKLFVIEFETNNSTDLSLKMQKVFDNSDNIIDFYPEKNEFFGDKSTFNEHLNLCSFVSDYSGKVYLDYEFVVEDESEISSAEVFSSGVWSNSVGYKSSKSFSYFDDVSVFETRIINQNEFIIKNISVNMEQLKDDSFRREISFVFDERKGLAQVEELREYLNSLNPRFANIENNDNELKIIFIGSAEEISLDLSTLFGDNNFVRLKTDYGFQLFEKTSMEDQIDFSNIIDIIGVYNNPIIYSYTSNKRVEDVSHRELGSASMNVSNSYDENGNILLSNGMANIITANCSKLNVFFIIVCSVAIVALISLVTAVILEVIYLSKKHKTVRGENGKKEVIEFLDEYCPTCGARVYKGSSYCRICGSIVGTIIEFNKKD